MRALTLDEVGFVSGGLMDDTRLLDVRFGTVGENRSRNVIDDTGDWGESSTTKSAGPLSGPNGTKKQESINTTAVAAVTSAIGSLLAKVPLPQAKALGETVRAVGAAIFLGGAAAGGGVGGVNIPVGRPGQPSPVSFPGGLT